MNAVDTEKFRLNTAERAETKNGMSIEKDCYAILFVGRLEMPKGPGRPLECIPFFKDQGLKFHIFLLTTEPTERILRIL